MLTASQKSRLTDLIKSNIRSLENIRKNDLGGSLQLEVLWHVILNKIERGDKCEQTNT